MPPFGPISRKRLIKCLRRAGFSPPRSGGNHEFMSKGDLDLTIPNPHHGNLIKIGLLKRILDQAGISRGEWEEL